MDVWFAQPTHPKVVSANAVVTSALMMFPFLQLLALEGPYDCCVSRHSANQLPGERLGLRERLLGIGAV